MKTGNNYPRFANGTVGLACLLAFTVVLSASWQVRAQSPTAAQGDRNPVLPEATRPLEGHTAPQVLDGTAIRVGHYDPENKLRLVLAVRPPHMAEEEQFLKELQIKSSPAFHRFLTPEEWNTRFAPSAEDEQKVVNWAQSQGLTVTNRYNHRLIVDVEGTAGAIEKAFGVTINNYQMGDEVNFANDRDPVLPESLSNIVYSVQGLNSIQRDRGARPESNLSRGPDYIPGAVVASGGGDHKDGDPAKLQERLKAGSNSSPDVTNNRLDPSDLYSSQIYNFNGLQALGHCCNPANLSSGSPKESSIAIAGFGQFLESDITGFGAANPYLAYNYNYYFIDGTPFCNATCGTGETTEDVEYSIATSNSFSSYLNTAHVYVYLGGNGNNSTYTDIYSQMLSDNTARVMTTSWSCTEIYGCSTSTMDSRHSIFNSMVGQGWTLIAASGDRGATDDCSHTSIAYPASDYDVLAAGGTSLQVYYPPLAFDYENGWQGGTYSGACGQNNGGSGGGVSVYYGKPSWQSAYGGSFRLTPDLSANALGVAQNDYINGAYTGDANGTSVVAPELAGFSAQENAYLLAIGNACGSGGTSACAPMGPMQPWIYEEGINHNAGHVPFYDITSGCNSNDITAASSLTYYCAHSSYDLVTGWGSANMMQLAWAINWEITTADATPSTSFNGPATGKWYNTDQIVGWTIVDNSGGGGVPGTGIAGFSQGWDSILPDSTTEPNGGSGDSFYSGPEYANATGGCLSFNGDGGCAGGSGQGCHTAHVRGWNNQGWTTGDTTYGPLCYDTVAPTVAVSNNPVVPSSGWFKGSVAVTLTAADPGGTNASGIYKTYYAVNTTACSPTSLGSCNVYSAPVTIAAQGRNYIYYFTEDNASNFSPWTYEYVDIDNVAPATTATLAGSLTSGKYYSDVQVTLAATDSLSGVAHTYYTLDGGSQVIYSAAFTVSAVGSHTVKFWSVDAAANIEATHTSTFTIGGFPATMSTPAASSILTGPTVTFTWAAETGATQYYISVGSTGVGSTNVFNSGWRTTTSWVVTGLPTNGEQLYVRLSTDFSGTVVHEDYLYTASTQASVTSPAASSVLTGPSVTFNWSAATGANLYYLSIGSTGVGSNNLFNTGWRNVTSWPVTGLPTNGETVYVRITTDYNGLVAHSDTTYTAATQAALTTPAPGGTLSGSSVTFDWTPGTTGATLYYISIGSTGVGSTNLYNSGWRNETSQAVTGLPTNGETIYVRLSTDFGGPVVHTDYTYKAQ